MRRTAQHMYSSESCSHEMFAFPLPLSQGKIAWFTFAEAVSYTLSVNILILVLCVALSAGWTFSLCFLYERFMLPQVFP